jgi:inner membrane protein involved in colicin E2 resistance
MTIAETLRRERSPGGKLGIAMLIAALLAIPLFSIYLLNWDRQNQSETASTSIVEGWGGPQTIAGPVLVIPYQAQTRQASHEDIDSMEGTCAFARNIDARYKDCARAAEAVDL